MPDIEPRSAPFEITIRLDPTAARNAAETLKRRVKSVASWFAAHSRGIWIFVSIVSASLFVVAAGGGARGLAVAAAGALGYGFMRLKARCSPLISD